MESPSCHRSVSLVLGPARLLALPLTPIAGITPLDDNLRLLAWPTSSLKNAWSMMSLPRPERGILTLPLTCKAFDRRLRVW
jgi:hypothetical protein